MAHAKTAELKVFVGYDAREAEMYDACIESIRQFNKKVKITPLVQDELRGAGLYWRPKDELASTAFSNTRFLVPYLSGFEGWSLFMDCDMILNADIEELMEYADDSQAVAVVKHDYIPKKAVKMDGCLQKALPRKNWSSVMLFNCGHRSTATLSPDYVNTVNAGILHRFEWCHDVEIGELPLTWNWLEGEYDEPDFQPKNIHYTNGHFMLGNKTEFEDVLVHMVALARWNKRTNEVGNILLCPKFEDCLEQVKKDYKYGKLL